MNNKVIGIISYLPLDYELRNIRKQKLFKLLDKCNEIFKLPIIIIAQNWDNSDLVACPKNCTVYRYDKLGITQARIKLREKFLESNFKYLIMFDDDAELLGTSGKEYLRQLDQVKSGFVEFNKSVLNLFAITEDLYRIQEFPLVQPEKLEGFEDRIFVKTLEVKYPEKKYVFINTGLAVKTITTNDKNSTWSQGKDLTILNKNTINIINTLKNNS